MLTGGWQTGKTHTHTLCLHKQIKHQGIRAERGKKEEQANFGCKNTLCFPFSVLAYE